MNDHIHHYTFLYTISEDGTPQLALVNYLIKTDMFYYICLQKLFDRGMHFHFHALSIDIFNEFFYINLNDIKYTDIVYSKYEQHQTNFQF